MAEKITKAQRMEALRKEVIANFAEKLEDAFQVDTGAWVFKMETGCVEVKFIVKGDTYNVADGVQAYADKVKAQADRESEKAKKVKKATEKKAE